MSGVRIDKLRLYHIHPQNLDWLGFCLVSFRLETLPAAANDV